MRHADSGATNSNGGSEPSLRSSDSQSCQQGCQTEHSEAVPTAAASRPGSTILELLIEDKPVAVAVRQKHRSSPAEQATASHAMPSDTSWNWSEDREGSAAHTVDRGPATADQQQAAFSSNACWTQIFSTEGEQLAAEREGMVYKGGWPGPQTHSLLKGQTPLVRHMHIVTTASGVFQAHVNRTCIAWQICVRGQAGH